MEIYRTNQRSDFLSGFITDHVLKDFYMKKDKPEGLKVMVTNDGFTITYDLPDYQASDVKVIASQDRLKIVGEMQDQPGKIIEESFQLPDNVPTDKVRADFEGQTLRIEVPKTKHS